MQGKTSCGVYGLYTDPAGKNTNRKFGMFAAYVSHEGHAFVD